METLIASLYIFLTTIAIVLYLGIGLFAIAIFISDPWKEKSNDLFDYLKFYFKVLLWPYFLRSEIKDELVLYIKNIITAIKNRNGGWIKYGIVGINAYNDQVYFFCGYEIKPGAKEYEELYAELSSRTEVGDIVLVDAKPEEVKRYRKLSKKKDGT